MLPSSSGIRLVQYYRSIERRPTSQGFFDFIQNQVHKLIVALECANDCNNGQRVSVAPSLLKNIASSAKRKQFSLNVASSSLSL
jgi:RNase P/RNase MRP subunit POP5